MSESDDMQTDDGSGAPDAATQYGVWITARADGTGGRWLLRHNTQSPWTGPEPEAERLARERNALYGNLMYEACEFGA